MLFHWPERPIQPLPSRLAVTVDPQARRADKASAGVARPRMDVTKVDPQARRADTASAGVARPRMDVTNVDPQARRADTSCLT
jgi:hypothetical protein